MVGTMKSNPAKLFIQCGALITLMLSLLLKSGERGRRFLRENFFTFLNPSSEKFKKLTTWCLDNYKPRLKVGIWESSSRVTPLIEALVGLKFFKAAEPSMRYHKPKVAFVRRGAMGDVLLAEPCIREFARKRPNVEVVIATDCPEVFKNHPYIRQTLPTKELKNFNEFSAVFDLDALHENQKEKHITRAYADLIIGNDDFDLQPQLYFVDRDRFVIEKFLAELSRPICVVHNRIDESQPFRNVDIDIWTNFLREVKRRHPDLVFLQIGLRPKDVAIEGEDFLDVRNQFTIHQIALLIENARLFIGTDAGPLHVAGTTNTPILSFFTYISSVTRAPLRARGAFLGVDSKIECAGCWTQFSRPNGWYCRQGSYDCSKRFKVDEAWPWMAPHLS